MAVRAAMRQSRRFTPPVARPPVPAQRASCPPAPFVFIRRDIVDGDELRRVGAEEVGHFWFIHHHTDGGSEYYHELWATWFVCRYCDVAWEPGALDEADSCQLGRLVGGALAGGEESRRRLERVEPRLRMILMACTTSSTGSKTHTSSRPRSRPTSEPCWHATAPGARSPVPVGSCSGALHGCRTESASRTKRRSLHGKGTPPGREILMAMSQESVESVPGTRIALRPLSERASRRRSLEQHVYVRFPALYRLLADAFARLPPRSRLRRLMLARAVRLAYAAANRRDFDVVLVGWDPGSEYRPSSDLMPPDVESVFHGYDGYLQLWRYWLDAFEDIRWDPEEVLDFGDRFLVTTEQKGHGSGSGVAVSEPVFQLFKLRRGMVIRQEDFLDRANALEAASLPD